MNTFTWNSKFSNNSISGYSSVRKHDFLNVLNIFVWGGKGKAPNSRVIFDICITFIKIFMPLILRLFFMMLFPYASFSIMNISEGDFMSKMQNLMFVCCSKGYILKSSTWKFCFVRNDLQLMLTVPEMNDCIFLISAANLQIDTFCSNEHLCECRQPFRKFDFTSYFKLNWN